MGAALEVVLAGLEDVTGGATAMVAGVAQEPGVTQDSGLGPAARALQAAERLVILTARLGFCVEDVRAYRAAARAPHRSPWRGR